MAVKSEPDVILYRGNYPGWPWLTAAGDRLLCAFRDDGVHGFSATGKVLWMESLDAGQSWSASRVAVDDAGVDDRNAAIAELPDKTWMIVYNSYSREKVSHCWVTTSQDQGENWSQPVSLADLDARTRSAPVALASGEILVPIYRAPGNGSIAVRSSDGGKTWAAAPVPDVEGFVGDEWDVLEVERGRIVGLIRNNGPRDGFFWKTESSDGGRSWRRPRQTNVQSRRNPSPPHLDFHGSTPVLTYADRRMVSVSMVISGDPEFVQWDLGHRIPCYQYHADGSEIADSGYPVSAATGPHHRLVVDYEIRPEGNRISGYFVKLPEGWK